MKRNIIRTLIIAVAAMFAMPQTADAQAAVEDTL